VYVLQGPLFFYKVHWANSLVLISSYPLMRRFWGLEWSFWVACHGAILLEMLVNQLAGSDCHCSWG